MSKDQTHPCQLCGKPFTFSAGEQELYRLRGKVDIPTRCPGCTRGPVPIVPIERQSRK